MSKLTLEIHEDIVAAVNRLRDLNETSAEVIIPEGSVLFENSLNIKLLKKEAERLGKSIGFSTTDEFGLIILSMLDEGVGVENISDDFVAREVAVGDIEGISSGAKGRGFGFGSKFKLRGMKFKLPRISLPSFRFNGKVGIIIGAVIIVSLVGAGYYFLSTVPEAHIKVIVKSQPLIKSVSIRVQNGAETDEETKTLGGSVVSTSITETVSTGTTGEKIVGEKASGRVRIYNHTGNDKDFEEGDELVYDDYSYFLTEDITVSAEAPEDPLVIGSPLVPGEGDADIEASFIGEELNIDSGEALEFDDYDRYDYIAEVIDDIDGGKSELIKVVAQEDLDKIALEISDAILPRGETELKSQVSLGQIYVAGSISNTLVEENYSASVGDEVEEVTLTQTLAFRGLVYSEIELNNLLDDMLKSFVPEGFELSSEKREVSVEILGASDSTVLNSATADLQVTLKSFVVPKVDEGEVISELAGAKIAEAQKVLSNIRNVKTYELEINPNIPFWGRLPRNIENISLEVKLN